MTIAMDWEIKHHIKQMAKQFIFCFKSLTESFPRRKYVNGRSMGILVTCQIFPNFFNMVLSGL